MYVIDGGFSTNGPRSASPSASGRSPHREWPLHPELLGLIVGARHEGHAGDAGRETQVILDPGGGASLAAECATVEHEYGEAFRPCIDRGGEARGPGAHDDNVIEAVRIDWAY